MFNSSYRKQVIIEKEDNKLERSRSLESEKSVYLLSKENFFQIDVELLNENVPINFPLFTIENMFFKEAYEPSSKPINYKSIKENRIPLFIKKDDIPLYEEYLKKVEKALKSDGSIKTYSRIVRETSKILVQELLMDPRSGEKIKETKDYIENVCEELLDGKISFIELITMKSFDFYTYTHSINVFAFCSGFGLHMGWDIERIKKISIGSIFHDIGKTMIPLSILNKPDRLSSEEFQIMKNHVIFGYELLKDNPSIPEESFDCITQHHENLSGSGYPKGLKGPEISEFGQVISIVDFYDALTTNRPYKPAWSPYKTLELLLNEEGKYNNYFVKNFIIMLGTINKT